MPGSSPRGRGKHAGKAVEAASAGLIPAWAGKTAARRVGLPHRQAHPRVGGENRALASRVPAVAGSSPRGRGKPGESYRPRGGRRLIPAWAGKTGGMMLNGCDPPAHPRVGGENTRLITGMGPQLGSSPRGRGKHRPRLRSRSRQRLIPAWAGKTQAGQRPEPRPWAHPRVGGENISTSIEVMSSSGSSPRGRGKRDTIWQGISTVGLIPAWAGKTRT